MDITLPLTGLVILFCLSAFFSGSESALFSLSQIQINNLSGGGTAAVIRKLLKHPGDLLVVILTGNLLVNVGIATIATLVCIGYFGDKGAEIAVLAVTPLLLIFGEIIPKSIALGANETISARVAPIFYWLIVRLGLAIRIINWANLGLIRFADRFFPPRRQVAAPEELKTIIEIGHGLGEIEPFEREIIGRLMDFKAKRVREIMTPRMDVFSLNAQASCNEAIEEARVRGLSFIPITDGEPVAVTGILHVKDLLLLTETDKSRPASRQTRPTYFVPETKRLDEMFRELKERRLRIAVVVAESDIFLGIVTLDDILSQIIGELRFRRETQKFDYRIIDNNTIIAAGNLKLSVFNKVFKTRLSDRYYETLAGYILSRRGTIPRTGDKFELDGLTFNILRAYPNRIDRLKVSRQRGEEDRTDGR
jgi:putative hemolysin